MNRAEFLRWRDAYEAAGIDENDQPPPALKALAATSGIVVSSTAPRAVHSATLLDRDVTTSPLLRELDLAPPNLTRVRMPWAVWAVLIGLRRQRVSAEERARAQEAAVWLVGLAERRDSVLAVTHGSLRSLLATQLIERGWVCETRPRRLHHWSVWSFKPAAVGPASES